MSKKSLDELVQHITVFLPCDRPPGHEHWPEDHFAVCDDDHGLIAFTPIESLAYKMRFDIINMRLNSADVIEELEYDVL